MTAQRDIPAAVRDILQHVEDALQAEAYFQYTDVSVEVPNGALHYKSTDVFPDHDWGEVRGVIEIHGVCVELHIALGQQSDASTVLTREVFYDFDAGEAKYDISGGIISLHDLRYLLSEIVMRYSPFSFKVTTIE